MSAAWYFTCVALRVLGAAVTSGLAEITGSHHFPVSLSLEYGQALPEASLCRRVLDEVFMGADHKKFIKVMERGESLVLMGRAQHQGV